METAKKPRGKSAAHWGTQTVAQKQGFIDHVKRPSKGRARVQCSACAPLKPRSVVGFPREADGPIHENNSRARCGRISPCDANKVEVDGPRTKAEREQRCADWRVVADRLDPSAEPGGACSKRSDSKRDVWTAGDQRVETASHLLLGKPRQGGADGERPLAMPTGDVFGSQVADAVASLPPKKKKNFFFFSFLFFFFFWPCRRSSGRPRVVSMIRGRRWHRTDGKA